MSTTEVLDAPLTWATVDKTGKTGEDLNIFMNMAFQHTGNKKYYKIRDILWDGTRDEWALAHSEVSADGRSLSNVRVVRPHTNFFGLREDQGQMRARYIQVTLPIFS